MKTLPLQPYSDPDPESRPLTSNFNSCDRQSGRWLFFNNRDMVIVVDSFSGTIRELNHTKEFRDLRGHMINLFFPDSRNQAWIIAMNGESSSLNGGTIPVSLYRLTFDYQNSLVISQKEKDLLAPDDRRYFNPENSRIYMKFDYNILTIEVRNVEDLIVVLLIYNTDSILNENRPDFVYKGAWLPPFRAPLLLGNRYYYFNNRGMLNEYDIAIMTKRFSTLYYYDFDTKFHGRTKLKGMPECIAMERAIFDRNDVFKGISTVWHGRHLFCSSSVRDSRRLFNNALAMLELDTLTWKAIDLNNEMRYTHNPLVINANNGILIFTNTHAKNPIHMKINGDFGTFISGSHFNKTKISFVYRMPINRPEKLIELARMEAAKYSPEIADKFY